MSLVRWTPFSEIDALFNRVMPATFARRHGLTQSENGDMLTAWAPSADISETEKEYLIRAELPAVKKEDVKVTVDGGMITIEGERKQHKEEKDEKSIRVESLYGTFIRTFQLPDDVKIDDIRCTDKDGVLTIHMPKSAKSKSKARQITVE